MTGPNIRVTNDEAGHAFSADDTAHKLNSHVSNGLAEAEAARRLERYGRNALAKAKQRSLLAIIV